MTLAPLTHALRLPELPWLLVGSYLLGSIPFGYLLARAFGKVDVRTQGSGNIGATNVARVVGKKLGAVTLLLDALKGAVPVLVAGRLFGIPSGLLPAVETLAGLSAFVGHCFPVWLRFRGGKGVATGAGFLFAHAPLAGGIGVVAFAITYALFRFVSLGSLVAAITVVLALLALRGRDPTLMPLAAMLVILVVKHRANIQRIARKQELKI